MGGRRRAEEVGLGRRGGSGKEKEKKESLKSESAFFPRCLSLFSGINLQADGADAATQGK